MLRKIILWSVANRGIVVLLFLALITAGAVAYTRLPTDAFPDISPVMVPVFAEAHGMAPEVGHERPPRGDRPQVNVGLRHGGGLHLLRR